MAPMKSNRLFSARLMPVLVVVVTALVAVSGQVQELEGVGCGCVTDKVIYDGHSCTSACDDCSGQGCAADSGAQFSQFNKALGDPAAAYEGSEGIRVTPTYWHNPFFRIATGRTDFRCHGFLEFMIKATAADGRPLRQRLVLSDQTQGSYVNLEDYVEDGVIDNTKWRKVSIPMIDLASDTFELNSVFMMSFVRMMGDNCFDVCGESCYDNPTFYRASCDDPQDFFVDNVILKPGIIGPKIKGSGVSSARVVTLRVDVMDRDSSAAAAAAASGSAFALTSEQDANFATPVAPVKVGYSRAPTYADEKGAVKEEWTVHLLYPADKKLLPGVQYTVTGLTSALVDCSGNTAAQDSFPVIFGATDVSTSIQVNQLGYLPKQPKHAYVANWLGDAGGMPVDESRVFHIVDSSDTTNIRYTGDLVLRFADDVQAGSDVYDVVFSDFQEPGNYRVSVPGIGLSYSFDINDTVLAPAAYATTRLLYYKRNIKLEEPYVDYGLVREPINSTLDGVFHPLLETYSLNNGESALEFKQIQPGWFDAGDYGHYMHNAWYIWPAFGMVFDLATKLPQDGELNIPESGNGVPDLLDELEFGMTWAMSMQADDGGVYWRLASRYFDQVLPKDVSLPRIIYEKTTRATAQFAGMAAIHSRLLRPYNAARADEVLAAGIKAWDFIQSHESYPPEGIAYRNPSEMPGGGEYSSTTSLPDQFWAAAELYRSTGDIKFQDAYTDLRGRAAIDPSGSPHSTYMYWAMVMSDHPNIDVVQRETARRILMSTADQKLERGAGHPYRVSKHPHIPWSGWHGQSGSVIYAPALLQAYYLTGNKTYSDAAFTSVDMSLGANPLSQVFITGIGHKPVLDPLDRVSLDDGIEQPVPGMPSPGFTWHLPGFREPYISINNAFYPSERVVDSRYNESYPVLRRYLDSHAAIPHNEGTIREAAMYAAPLTIMSDGEHPPKVDGSYEWTWKGRTHVRSQVYVPMAEIPLIFPSYITEWGAYVGHAPAEYLNVLTSEQICAINAPTTPHWVGRLSDEKKEALCEQQIVAFEHYSLIIRLPPSKVPIIPCEKLPTLAGEIRNTSPEWKAALTTEQISCLSPEQYEWLGFTSPPTSAPTAPTPSPTSPPTRLTLAPTSLPTRAPTSSPTSQPTRLSLAPTTRPTSAPSLRGTTNAPSRRGTASPVSSAETIIIGDLSSGDKLIYDEHTCTSTCDDCSGQGCAADSGAQFSQFNKALGDPAAAYEGSEGIRVTPTYWHDPFFRIATGRTDFSSYESLDFMIKATAADGRPLRQRLVLSDASKGSYVDLENYVADGVIDNTKWRKVSIPIADLVSPEFALDRVFIMSFVRMMGDKCFDVCGESCYDNPTFYSASCDTPQDFFIDNIVLKAFESTGAPTVQPTVVPVPETASPVSSAKTIIIGDLSSDDKLIYDEHTCTSACDNCSGQGCAADSGAQFSQFNKALGDPAAAYEGSEGIRVTPTYWHDPFFRIATGRTDFSSYESLDFMIKATAADGRPLRQRLVLSDASKGSYVDLENYVADGVIDNTKWRKVSIPIADLVSPEFALDRVFIMSFVRMMGDKCFDVCGESCYDNPTFYSASCDTPQDFFIDNIVLKAFDGIRMNSLGSDDKLIYDEHTCTSACDNCSGQGCAADSGAQFSQFNKALGDPAAAYEGSEGIRVTPTYWHDPFFRIATGRTDFSSYESLDFMIKATAADGRPLRQRLVLSDASKGSYVDLENYVADGVIDNTKWRKVSIPIADLVSPEFALDRVFIMSFVRMMGDKCFDVCGESCYDNPTFYSASCDTPQDFFIDNIVLMAF